MSALDRHLLRGSEPGEDLPSQDELLQFLGEADATSPVFNQMDLCRFLELAVGDGPDLAKIMRDHVETHFLDEADRRREDTAVAHCLDSLDI